MDLQEAYNFYLSLHPILRVILGFLLVGIIFSIFKKFIKVAVWLVVLAILIVILYKLLMTI